MHALVIDSQPRWCHELASKSVKYKGDETTREYILRLAIEAIEQGGEAAVKAKEICRTADIAVTSLYHYFGSRDGLVIAAQAKRYADSIQDVYGQWDSAVRSCRNKEDLKRVITIMLDLVLTPDRSHARMIRLNVLGSSYARPALQAAIVEHQERLFENQAATLEYAKEQGWVRSEVDTKALTAWHIGVVTGYTLLELGPTNVNLDEWKRLYRNALIETVMMPD